MKLAIYDFDGTYIKIQTLPFLYKLWKEKKINNQAYRKYWGRIMRRYLLNKLNLFGWDKVKFRRYAMAVSADLFRSIEYSDLENFLEEFYVSIAPYISTTMKEQLQKDIEDGYETVLLSGNFTIILKPFLQEGFHHVLGTKILEQNALLSSSEVDIIMHQKKSDLIQENFPDADLSKSKAYADSGYDSPILYLVGHPVVVNPDAALLELAKKNNWEIQIN